MQSFNAALRAAQPQSSHEGTARIPLWHSHARRLQGSFRSVCIVRAPTSMIGPHLFAQGGKSVVKSKLPKQGSCAVHSEAIETLGIVKRSHVVLPHVGFQDFGCTFLRKLLPKASTGRRQKNMRSSPHWGPAPRPETNPIQSKCRPHLPVGTGNLVSVRGVVEDFGQGVIRSFRVAAAQSPFNDVGKRKQHPSISRRST